MMVTPPEKAKDESTYVEISFEKGWPVKVDTERPDLWISL